MSSGNKDEMEFLEDLAKYNQSMENAYMLITGEGTVSEILDANVDDFYLPFNPLEQDGRDDATLDLLIEHFTQLEEYEKCARLFELKSK